MVVVVVVVVAAAVVVVVVVVFVFVFVRLHSDSKTTYQTTGSLKSGRIWSCSKSQPKLHDY